MPYFLFSLVGGGYKVTQKPLIHISQLHNYLGGQWVHKDLNLKIYPREIVAVIGPSGCGKTTLLRSILMLQPLTGGCIQIFNQDIASCTDQQSFDIRRRWGVMFQSSALFSSLCALENVLFPLQEMRSIQPSLQKEVALLKLMLVGLELEVATKYPAELSGGMKKRVALARAIALDPELVFLDEPTSGLDAKGADQMDHLILKLRDSLGITFFMITHDLDTLWRVPDRIIFLGEGCVLAAMPMAELVKQPHPLIRDYFDNARAYSRVVAGGARHNEA